MTDHFDVAILGSGIGGSMLAAVLAKQGVRTILIEAGTHPRFAIGESLVPETSLRLKLLGERFGVPEIGYLGSFHALRDHVSPACGVKRSFAFVYHRPNQEQRGSESNELPTLTPPFGPDAHLFRQDTDQWLVMVAARYGAEVRQNTRVQDVELRDDGVTLHLADKPPVTASFVVDGTGRRALIGRKLGLLDSEPRFQTDSRAIFTHMINVVPYDAVGPDKKSHGMPVPFSQSTLHHCFEGGWIWVIPFDNHRSSTNELCSVGLVLDRRVWGDATLPAEEEFRRVVARFPSVARQFEDARAIRPWISSGRLQFSSRTTIGPRFCILPHAAGFVDPLYSSGMSLTVGCIDLLAGRLCDAVAEGDFSVKRFQPVDDLIQAALDHYDVIVSNSFDSWRHYETWNAWNRIWALGNYLGTWGPLRLLVKWKQTGDRRFVTGLDQDQQLGLLASQHDEFMAVRDDAATVLRRCLQGHITPSAAADEIVARIGQLDFIPGHVRFSSKDAGRAPTVFTLLPGARHILWYQWRAPAKWRAYCAFPLRTYARLTAGHIWTSLRGSAARLWRSVRDIFWTHNTDWRKYRRPLPAKPRLKPAIDEQRAKDRPPAVARAHMGRN